MCREATNALVPTGLRTASRVLTRRKECRSPSTALKILVKPLTKRLPHLESAHVDSVLADRWRRLAVHTSSEPAGKKALYDVDVSTVSRKI